MQDKWFGVEIFIVSINPPFFTFFFSSTSVPSTPQFIHRKKHMHLCLAHSWSRTIAVILPRDDSSSSSVEKKNQELWVEMKMDLRKLPNYTKAQSHADPSEHMVVTASGKAVLKSRMVSKFLQ